MTEKNNEFVPLLFAGDYNVYSVARAFHEAYGITVTDYGKFYSGPCVASKIIDYRVNEHCDEQDTFLKLVNDFADEHQNKKVLLIGCGDSYVELAAANKGNFRSNVIAPYIDVDLMHELINKEKFYALCDKYGVDHPATFVHRKEMGVDVELPFDAPYIVKPANGIEYWRHPFETQKKVYTLDTYEEFQQALNDIYGAGYNDALIVQEYIPGDDTYMRVLTNYSDRNGKVKMMCLGHVLLEEHTPHGIGNHAVIITEENKELEDQFRRLLEAIGYVGFSNFDIKYDERDGKYKAFEINTRQGRSNYYVTGAGANIARILVEDRVEGRDMDFFSVSNENLWLVVPKQVAFDYVSEQEYKDRMKKLFDEGKFVNPLDYAIDNKFMRKLRLRKNQNRHYKNFATYYHK
ncbi:MAG: ATP-grasp domain-containing protein [Eubacteriaceae bacterium]|jgi:D-aspartate ligase|nr:ATP-grasp domain-containing protein [Eubacteriaceae bacterium]